MQTILVHRNAKLILSSGKQLMIALWVLTGLACTYKFISGFWVARGCVCGLDSSLIWVVKCYWFLH